MTLLSACVLAHARTTGSSVCSDCEAGKYQATAGVESVCVRGRDGEVGKARKKESKIHLHTYACDNGFSH